MLEWAKAIEEVEKFASLDRLVTLSNNIIGRNGYSKLVRLNEAFSIANMSAIYNAIINLKNNLRYFTENENKIIKLISPRIEEFVKQLTAKSLSEFQFKLSKFFASKNQYSLAYIALAEAVISYICEKEKLNNNNIKDREKVKNIIREGFDRVYLSHPKRKFADLYMNKISKIRNNIAHQLETSKQPKADIENFSKYYSDVRKYLKETF